MTENIGFEAGCTIDIKNDITIGNDYSDRYNKNSNLWFEFLLNSRLCNGLHVHKTKNFL
jgi:hypothetical protein